MIQCPACEGQFPQLKSSPALCESCYTAAMNELTRLGLESGAKQERDRVRDALKSMRSNRKPLWLSVGEPPKDALQAYEQAVDIALSLVQ